MYPKPEIFNPDIIGKITDAVKMGFEIYNKIKELLPGGSAAGTGDVTGTPDNFELTDLKLIGGDTE